MRPVLHLITAARPNFMKVAPLLRAFRRENWSESLLVHTGQHYDACMSDVFFGDLRMPKPDFLLGVGSGTHSEQTAGVMLEYERVCRRARPDWIIVVGDVNSTMACALVGAKLCIPVGHVEAGLRSGDRRMPEEINRIVTDAVADLLWTPSSDGDANLRSEGIPASRIERVGNIMIDAYELMRPEIQNMVAYRGFDVTPRQYVVATLHRPSNVDDHHTLQRIISQITAVAERSPVIFPVHPRTRRRLEEFGLLTHLQLARGIRLAAPMGYIAFMSIVSEAAMVITDSGGIQEETTYLNIPCLTVRDTTERPITLVEGTNKLVRPDSLYSTALETLSGQWQGGRKPDLWDGNTAPRIVASLRTRLH